MRGVRSTFVTSASSQTTSAASSASGGSVGHVGQRAGQEVDAEVDPRAGRDQLLDLRVGLGRAERRVELDQHQLRHRQPEAAGQLAGHDLGRQRLRPLARAAELQDVEAVVVGLDDGRQRAALAQRGHVARGGHRAQHPWHDGGPMTPPVLWTPPESLLERAAMTSYLRERGLRRPTPSCGAGRSRTSRASGARSGTATASASAATPCSPRARCPARSGSPGTLVNYAEHAFRDRDDDALAIVAGGETREDAEWTWGELREQVRRIAAGLRALGVERGDRVVAYMPNIPETAAAFLACASLGAIWSSCSPDFGARSVIDRFAQIEPKVLLAVDGYRYNGRDFDRRDTVRAVRDAMPGLGHTVLLRYHDGDATLEGARDWDELTAADEELAFERVPFDHPLWVLYSSGTTGLPKAIVQSQGGILLEHLKMLHLHVDAQAGDRLFWFTTTGWMMWNFIVSGLLTEATILLYDGSPGHPDMGVLWDFAARTEHDHLRHQRELHRRVHEGGRRARRRDAT